MNMQQAAQQALDVQNACNLSGVSASLTAIVRDVIWPEANRLGKGTDWVNTHPIVSLFIDKDGQPQSDTMSVLLFNGRLQRGDN